MSHPRFHRDILRLDAAAEVERIVARLRHDIYDVLRRKGGVLGVSGGVDSAVALALAVRALGAENLVALLLPEMESSPDSARLARQVCSQFGVTPLVEEMTGPCSASAATSGATRPCARLPRVRQHLPPRSRLPGKLLDQDTLNVFR
jgi:NAD+ synthase